LRLTKSLWKQTYFYYFDSFSTLGKYLSLNCDKNIFEKNLNSMNQDYVKCKH